MFISRLDSTMRKDAMIEFRGGLERVSVSENEHTLRVGLGEERVCAGLSVFLLRSRAAEKSVREMVVSLKVRLFGQVFVAGRQLERHSNIFDQGVGLPICRIDLNAR